MPFDRLKVFWISYGFGMFAILFQAWVFKTADAVNGTAKSRFYGFPIIRIGLCYLAVQVALSLLGMAYDDLIPVWVVLLVFGLLLIASVIGCITVEAMRDEIAVQDGKLKNTVFRMRELQSLSATLVNQCTDDDLKKTVKKIADELRFSDPVSSDATAALEDELRRQLGEVQQAIVDGDTEGAKALCVKVMGNLTERNRVCSISK